MKRKKIDPIPWILFAAFVSVAVLLAHFLHNRFYFWNFFYIGSCLSVGVALYRKKVRYARHAVQIGVGLYMLVYLGILSGENMQIEGFWYYLFLGVFEAATIHYLVAKIAGPLLFGRGWCGYACWTAMALDLLPWKQPQRERRRIGWIRYVTFACSLLFVSLLFLLQVPNLQKIMLWNFIIGNVLYYAVGIVLAAAWKDNRAFCKYICPITVFLKPASYFSLFRMKVDAEKCIRCGKCVRACPMEVDLLDPKRSRKNGTECILCFRCAEACPTDALK